MSEKREYQPVTIEDRGVHVVDPPDYIGITLDLIADADDRALRVDGSMVYLGSSRSVAYKVVGIDLEDGRAIIQCAKWSTLEALEGEQAT